MNKKQHRQGKRERSTPRATPAAVTPRATSAVVTPRTTPSAPARTAEFNPDYSYVIKDLRRIGLLAGTFITILIVLSFFLR